MNPLEKALSESQPLIAFTFGSPFLLAWAIALAIPVLIHLWNRNRYQEIDWAAMRFLMQAVKQNSRRITLQQLILLAARALIFILLAIAIANPLLRKTTDDHSIANETKTLHVIVVDASYSMGVQSGGRTLWDNAIEAATAKIDAAVTGDAFALIKMAEPPEIVVQEPSFDRNTMKQELSGLRITNAGADLESSLRSVDAILATVARGKSEFNRHEVTFYSDLGENTWNEVSQSGVRQLIDSISRRAILTAEPMGSTNCNNIAITSVSSLSGPVLPGDSAAISATLQNFGSENSSHLNIDLFVDGESKQRRSVEIPAGQQADVAFTSDFEFPGDHRVEVRVTADELPIDNRRYLILPVRNSMRVLCVGGRPGETENLRWALQPNSRNQNGEQSRIETTAISFAAISEMQLSDFNCVVICNAAGFRPAESKQLQQYVSGGGGLVLFLGDSVQADSYNRQLLENSDPPLLPARILGQSDFTDQRLVPNGYEHPIIDPFRGVRQSGLLTTPIWKYFRVDEEVSAANTNNAQANTSNKSRVAIEFENGDPLIVTREVGFGRVVLFTSSASGKSTTETSDGPQPWSAFHTWPSYVSLVHEMVHFAISEGAPSQNSLVGDFLAGQVSRSLFSRTLTLTGPNDEPIDVNLEIAGKQSTDSGSKQSTWSAGPIETPGFFRMQGTTSTTASSNNESSETTQNETRFAVNVDIAESDLARLVVDELPIQFQNDSEVAAPAALPVIENSPSIFQYILASLLLLLIVEGFLAWFFGRDAGIRNDSSPLTSRAN